MLTLTRNAVEAITALKASSDEIPDEAGLRIAAETVSDEGASLHVAVVSEPEDADVVLEAEGEQVFLEPLAATLLADKVLDAQMTEGGIAFAVGPQSSDDGTVPGA